MELGNLAEDKEAEDREDSSDGNRHSGDEDEGESSKGGGGGNKRNVARTFRYMRKRPTIIFYKPPEGELLCLRLCECSGLISVTCPRSGH